MTCFAEIVLLYAKTEHKYAEPGSNLFIKNDLYHDLVNALSCRNQPLRTEAAEQAAFWEKMQEFAGLFPLLPPAPPAAYAQPSEKHIRLEHIPILLESAGRYGCCAGWQMFP